ncbi:MAG: hypothetical protein AVDCRST_MAG68-5195 [uncultured Gemmatimonadetes bacterium]|uniref:Glycosyltransferase RgtA/B/C/D-like domain-containing protein n=1 Tax=uncultured Gemmatimonadota bacterium TaxID=203437 RepID=A0A6J4MWB1_9BACT|nr:MAG: hypothetical protein AVDCRST_MAG68-5195 [uncultured Gemmatimonadota bacterium]
MTPGLRPARGRAAWLAAGAAVFAVALAFSAASGFGTADESWYLRVIARTLAGDVLYRDTFLGVTPLSVFLVAPLAALFGTEILVVKAAVALCFAASVLTGCAICRRLGAGWGATLVFGASLFAYLLPGLTRMGAPYSPLAVALLLGCFALALRWAAGTRAEGRVLAAAGALAGLCFMAKQNMGVYALAALVAAVVFAGPAGGRGALRRTAVVAVSFAGVVVLAAVPVVASGGLEALVDYGFTGKGTYLRAGRISFFGEVAELLRLVAAPSPRLLLQHQFALPFLAFPVMLAAWIGAEPGRRKRATIVLLFAGAGFLGVFPRADATHLAIGTPFLLLGVVHGWRELRLRGRAPRAAAAGAAAWVAILLAATLSVPARRLVSGRFEVSELPHFRGVVVVRGQSRESLLRAGELARSAPGGEILLLSPRAGFYYLLTGLENPTPYDYPLSTTFGSGGQARVEAMIRRGRIRTACLDPATPPGLRPEGVERAVRRHLRFSHRTGLCAVYRS